MNKLYNYIKEHCIALYKAGSYAVPFLKNQRDTEYALFCETADERATCREIIYPSPILENNVYVIQEQLVNPNTRFVMPLPLHCEIWSYQYHYAYIGEHYGKDVKEYDYNILDHKKDYIDKLIAFYYENHKKQDKQWYHVLIGLYILENNSYDLTQEQQEQVQLAHDCQMTDMAHKYAINSIKKYIDNYDLIDLSANELEIIKLKKCLADTDYQAIKFAEGEMSAEEYAPIKEQRANWRKQINDLQK